MAPTTAERNLRLLLDAESFTELPLAALSGRLTDASLGAAQAASAITNHDGVFIGTGKINGQPVVVFAQDGDYRGGSIGPIHGRAITQAQEFALANGLPIIGIWNGGGARLQEGVHALTAVGEIFRNNVLAKGKIPQISLVLGPCAGAACYSPALTDFLIIADDVTKMFLTGPAVTADFIGEKTTIDELGGAEIHSHNGVADYVASDAAAAIQFARRLLGYVDAASRLTPPGRLGETGEEYPPHWEGDNTGWESPVVPQIPDSPTQPYDIRGVLANIFDDGTFLELQATFAENLVTGFARLAGKPVAIVASQPKVLAGTLDANAAEKGARFIATAAIFGIPIITFVDVPGFLPGVAQEKAGVIRKGANLVAAYVNAQVPKITVILRKGFGGAYIALNSTAIGATKVISWPDAEVAVMGAAGAIDVLHHRELAKLQNENLADKRKELIQSFKANSPGLEAALESGQISAIMQPAATRSALISALSESQPH